MKKLPTPKSITGAPRVFISSTTVDLEPYRAAREAVIKAGMLPVMSEDFASTPNPPLKECQEQVSGTHLLIVLVGHRYGWIPPEQPTVTPRKSITWLECERAMADGNDVLGFMIGHKGEWPAELREEHRLAEAVANGTDTDELIDEVREAVRGQKAFHQWVKARTVKFVQTPQDLYVEVFASLRDWRDQSPEFEAAQLPSTGSASPEKYLNRLFAQTSLIDIRGLSVGTGKAHHFPIEDLFIALQSRRGPTSSKPADDSGASVKENKADVESQKLLE